ncbi:MAG: helix-turn-helix domain-containing protein [Candidatus Parvarchaeota archaeon]|nr:helix-turn-helix domain-containing protein [Candidatus Parvarchaeota archaeon]
MNCELCGFTDDKFYRVEIEGAVMTVCSKCSSFGKIIKEVEEHEIEKKPQKSYGFVERSLKMDYLEILNNAMNEKNMTAEKLAEEIKESPYEIKKILKGKIMPTDAIAKKIESALKVSIYEDIVGTFKPTKESNEVSIDYIAQIKQMKQG